MTDKVPFTLFDDPATWSVYDPDADWRVSNDFGAAPIKAEDSTVFYDKAIIYNDTPRPSFWRHPIKWWLWKPQIIGYLDMGADLPSEPADFTITFPDKNASNRPEE